MPYEFMSTRVLAKTVEQGSHLIPDHYAVAAFSKRFTGKCEVTSDADMNQVLGRTIPLRYAAEEPDVIYRSNGAQSADRSRAHVARGLLSKYDDLDTCSGDCVPMEIVAQNDHRADLAMYLYVYQEKEYDEIAETLDVNTDTVKRYRRRIR